MAEGVYRDRLTGLRAQLRHRLEGLNARLDRFESLFFEALDPAVRHSLVSLRGRLDPHGLDRDAPEALDAFAADLDAAERLVDAELARLPEREQAWSTPADRPPEPRVVEAFAVAFDLIDPRERTTRAERLLGELRHLDPAASLSAGASGRLWLGQFRVDGVALGLGFGCQIAVQNNNPLDLVYATVAMPPATAPLTLRPQGWGAEFGSWLGLVRDQPTGDGPFDATFVVDASAEVTRRLLGPTVRGCLLTLAREDVPSLRVGPGFAELRWVFEPHRRALAAMAEALVALHRVGPTRAFLRPETDSRGP